jgi:hypothetical protein
MMPVVLLAIAVAGAPVSLPAEFSAGRVLLTPRVAATRARLRLWMDTDGSGFLPDKLIQALGLRSFMVLHHGKHLLVAQPPTFIDRFPAPLGLHGGIPVTHLGSPERSDPLFQGIDGQLGASWFQDRVWSFDYLRHRVFWYSDGRIPKHDAGNEVPFSFALPPVASLDGSEYPRVEAVIDGATLSMSLDTGASVALSDASLRVLGDGLPAVRGASFVRHDVAASWHRKRPHWRYVADAGQSAGIDLIRVPRVRLGAVTLSNVWFSTRPHDDVFEGDAVAGKLGGTAFDRKVLFVDYRKRIAVVSPSKG